MNKDQNQAIAALLLLTDRERHEVVEYVRERAAYGHCQPRRVPGVARA